MESPLITYFKNYLSLSYQETEFLDKNVPIVEIKSDDFLLKAGEISSAFYFVIEGFIRMYYLVDGVEKTTFFYEKNDFVSSYESYTQQAPAKHYLQPIKDSKVAVFDIDVVSEMLSKFPRFELLSRIVMEKELAIHQDIISFFITMNAAQRYVNLAENKPHLLQEIPQYHIATYLGVSPETLSRIRKRIQTQPFIDDRQ